MFLKASTFLALGALLVDGAHSLSALEPRDRGVEIRAVAQNAPPRITLQWNAPNAAALVQQKLYRRAKGASDWAELASLPREVTTFNDDAVAVGVSYEYFVYRVYDVLPGTASGWLSAGIRAPFVAERGKVILLVDDTMTAPLKTELAQFMSDLNGDGWTVVRQDVSRAATPASIRAVVQSLYRADAANTVALILFGHIPVPYAGDYSADSHPEHFGAWPADAFYGDIDGGWTDSTANDTRAAQARNWNVPGDGKLDQSVLPSDVELQVGRIDLASMPAFSLSETELLRQYLARDHAFRFLLGNYASVPRRGLVDDHFGFAPGEVFAASGWRNFAALFGSANVQALDWFTTLSTQKYLAAYGCGPGSYTTANGVGTTAMFATQPSQAVFNLIFGSYHGDWDSPDNFLRAPLAGPAASLGLVSAWAGRPHWFIHPLGLGETIGYCTRQSQNNLTTFPNGYEANDCERAVHIALMGDPTLRLHPVLPPANLTTQLVAGNAVQLTWTASADSPIEGYLVSRGTSSAGPFTRLNGGVITGSSFVDRSVTAGVTYTYMVRAVKLETTTSGTYLNTSQGIFSAPVRPAVATGPEINLVGAGQMISDDDTVALRSNDTDFGPLELGPAVAAHAYSLRNAGNQPLSLTSVQLSGANATDFGVSALPASIAAGQATTFYVAFRPSAVGFSSARLTIGNNDANESLFDFPLGGSGVAPRAILNVNTPSLDVSLPSGGTGSASITLSNSGAGALAYTASSALDTYSFRDSDTPGGPAYNWVEISATGSLVTGWFDLDDAATSEIPLGFNFPLYGATLSTVRIDTNGFIGGPKIIPYGQNGPLPNTSAALPMIAPFWTDVVIDAGSRVYWQNVSGNFVVQYDNVSLLGSANRRFTAEAILKPSGEIVFQYKTLAAVSGSYTIGIQNRLGDDALLISYGANYAHAGMAIRIRPPGLEHWLALPAPSGALNANASTQLALTFSASGLAPGEYYSAVTIRSNTADGKPKVVAVHLTVTP